MTSGNGRLATRVAPLLLPWVEALPLCVFLASMKLADPQVWHEWRPPYYLATLAAALTIALFLHWRRPLNRIHLALALYFASGSVALAIPWQWLNRFYGRWQATAMLGWVLVVLAIGLLAPRERSPALIGVAALAFAASWWFQGNELLSAYVPFVVLFTAAGVLQRSKHR